MKTKKIKQHNDSQFLIDIKSVKDVLVYAQSSRIFLKVLKKDVLKEAEDVEIQYYLTDEIFVRKRIVMVII